MMYKKYSIDIFGEKPNNQSYTKEFKTNVTSKKGCKRNPIDFTSFPKQYLLFLV